MGTEEGREELEDESGIGEHFGECLWSWLTHSPRLCSEGV